MCVVVCRFVVVSLSRGIGVCSEFMGSDSGVFAVLCAGICAGMNRAVITRVSLAVVPDLFKTGGALIKVPDAGPY